MMNHTKVEDKLEGADNFRSWKYRISLILKENDQDKYINEDVPEPEGEEARENHKKNMIRAKRIIADSIKDNLIPHVSSLKTTKKMFDALNKLFEGNNIKNQMTMGINSRM